MTRANAVRHVATAHPRARAAALRVPTSWHAASGRGRVGFAVLATATATAPITWWKATPWSIPIGVSISLLILVGAAIVDADERRLPDMIVATALIPIGLALALCATAAPAAGAAAGVLVAGGPLLLGHLISPAGLGFGDVKTASVIGLAVGSLDARVALLAICLASCAAACWGLARRRRTVAFGPFLVGGAVLAVASGRPLLDELAR